MIDLNEQKRAFALNESAAADENFRGSVKKPKLLLPPNWRAHAVDVPRL
jgi:hypothetical protein